MKKNSLMTLFTAIIVSLGSMSLLSCGDDNNQIEDNEVDTYALLSPCLYWDGSMEDVRSLLSSNLPKGYILRDTDENPQCLFVQNSRDSYPIAWYEFKDGKLNFISICYRRSNDSQEYKKLCEELDKRYERMNVEENEIYKKLDYENFWFTKDHIHVAYLQKNSDNSGNKLWDISFYNLFSGGN